MKREAVELELVAVKAATWFRVVRALLQQVPRVRAWHGMDKVLWLFDCPVRHCFRRKETQSCKFDQTRKRAEVLMMVLVRVVLRLLLVLITNRVAFTVARIYGMTALLRSRSQQRTWDDWVVRLR